MMLKANRLLINSISSASLPDNIFDAEVEDGDPVYDIEY